MISDLQDELVKVRLRDAENEAIIRDLKDRIGELEHVSVQKNNNNKKIYYQIFFRIKKLFANQLWTILLHISKKN